MQEVHQVSYMDKQGNLTKIEDYLTSSSKITTHNEYNYAGQLTKTIDSRNIPLSYTYGYFGVEKIDYPGVIRADDVFEYNFIDSKRIVRKKRDSNYIETHLDELDREKKVIYNPTRKLRKYYNSSGLIKEANFSSINKIYYDYDERGQLIDVQQFMMVGTILLVIPMMRKVIVLL